MFVFLLVGLGQSPASAGMREKVQQGKQGQARHGPQNVANRVSVRTEERPWSLLVISNGSVIFDVTKQAVERTGASVACRLQVAAESLTRA